MSLAAISTRCPSTCWTAMRLASVNWCWSWWRLSPTLMAAGREMTSPASTGQMPVKPVVFIRYNNQSNCRDEEAKARTDVGREGEPAEAGAADSAGGSGQVVSRGAAGVGCGHLR